MKYPHPLEFLNDFRFNVAGFFPALNGRSLDIVGRLGISYGNQNNITVVVNYDPFMKTYKPGDTEVILSPVTATIRAYDPESVLYPDHIFFGESDPQTLDYYFDIIENNKEKFLLRYVQTIIFEKDNLMAHSAEIEGLENLKEHLERLVVTDLVIQRPL